MNQTIHDDLQDALKEAEQRHQKQQARSPSRNNGVGTALAIVSMAVALYGWALVANWKLTVIWTLVVVVPISVVVFWFLKQYCRIKFTLFQSLTKKSHDFLDRHPWMVLCALLLLYVGLLLFIIACLIQRWPSVRDFVITPVI